VTHYCNSTQSCPSLPTSQFDLVNHVTLPRHIPEPLCTLTHTPDPDMLCCILVAHSNKHMFPLLCIAPTWNIIHSFTYLVLYPLWSYAPMLSPHIMFPSVCFMFIFPVAPWISPILLQDPIWFVLVFKTRIYPCTLVWILSITAAWLPLVCSPLWIILSESLRDLVS